MSDKKSVLFICLGNICRSPIAEAVFINIVKRENLTEKYRIDSAAVSVFLKRKINIRIINFLFVVVVGWCMACWKNARSKSYRDNEEA